VPDRYLTVAERASARFEVQGSAFIGHISPVETVDAAEQFIDAISEEYADATHNVPAYRVRGSPFREYANDAGEPSGSAGKPALNVLQQREIENVVAVITRYYGGTNLGVGGLARAYSRAVKDGLDAAGVTESVPHERFQVTVAYDDSGDVRGLLESADADFDADYDAEVTFSVRVPRTEASTLRDRILSATSGRAKIISE
jgi:uncharacterized YigZ family protein